MALAYPYCLIAEAGRVPVALFRLFRPVQKSVFIPASYYGMQTRAGNKGSKESIDVCCREGAAGFVESPNVERVERHDKLREQKQRRRGRHTVREREQKCQALLLVCRNDICPRRTCAKHCARVHGLSIHSFIPFLCLIDIVLKFAHCLVQAYAPTAAAAPYVRFTSIPLNHSLR